MFEKGIEKCSVMMDELHVIAPVGAFRITQGIMPLIDVGSKF